MVGYTTKIRAKKIINRRIGHNELAAVRVALSHVDAQKDHFERIVQQTGTGLYAERPISTPGRQDGLYRTAAAGASESPFPPQGGAMSYMKSRRMTGGFALIAWPAIFGSSGIMTFQVDQDGVVFKKDLGTSTTRIASRITQFDPDPTWARVEITNQ